MWIFLIDWDKAYPISWKHLSSHIVLFVTVQFSWRLICWMILQRCCWELLKTVLDWNNVVGSFEQWEWTFQLDQTSLLLKLMSSDIVFVNECWVACKYAKSQIFSHENLVKLLQTDSTKKNLFMLVRSQNLSHFFLWNCCLFVQCCKKKISDEKQRTKQTPFGNLILNVVDKVFEQSLKPGRFSLKFSCWFLLDHLLPVVCTFLSLFPWWCLCISFFLQIDCLLFGFFFFACWVYSCFVVWRGVLNTILILTLFFWPKNKHQNTEEKKSK